MYTKWDYHLTGCLIQKPKAIKKKKIDTILKTYGTFRLNSFRLYAFIHIILPCIPVFPNLRVANFFDGSQTFCKIKRLDYIIIVGPIKV